MGRPDSVQVCQQPLKSDLAGGALRQESASEARQRVASALAEPCELILTTTWGNGGTEHFTKLSRSHSQ